MSRSLPSIVLGVLAVLAACSTPVPQGPASPAGDAAAFPVTITTAFGDVTIPAPPRRVVALGWGDAETAVALGVEPVGAADWLALRGDGLGPWMTQRYTTPPKILGTLEVELEQVAALEPDLILDTRSSGEQVRQDKLAQLGVPVVALPSPAAARYLTTWEDQLDMIGRALGRSPRAATLKAELDAKFMQVAAAHPGFRGATVVVGARTSAGWGAYVEGSSRINFMRRLGFVNSPAVQALAAKNFSVPISPERLDLYDADLTIVFPIEVSPETITGDPLFRTVPSVAAGRVVVPDRSVAPALASATAPGLSYALDVTVPLFAAALQR